jgi:outer membrane protein OmpA-like peptidoglycan-associated protein
MKSQTVTIFKFSLLVFFLISLSSSFAQVKDYKMKGGININYMVPLNEFDELEGGKLSYVARGFLRWKLNNTLGLEVGAGYGSYAGLDNYVGSEPTDRNNYYRTQLIPIDVRLLISPFNNKKINPYLFLGAGILSYKVTDPPKAKFPRDRADEEDGITGIIPAGIGMEFMVTPKFSLDLTLGGTYTFTEDLNLHEPTKSTPKDAWLNAGLSAVFVLNGGNPDKDKDGLLNEVEERIGTDPENADSDGDRLKDGDEVNKYKTDPLKADTDGDNLSDYDEIKKYMTDPTKGDTDVDGLNDYDEISVHSTDPLDEDTDHDGLNDGKEVLSYKTNPSDADTDKDGLTDGEEVNTYNTSPLRPDSDSDTLSDFAEVKNHKTDPLKADTDGGSVNDGAEVVRDSDPLDPSDDIMKINVPIVLDGITFAVSSAEISESSKATLEGALKTLNSYEDIVVEIRGYTDNTGSRSFNMKLSKRRAESVKNWLVNKGIDKDRMVAKGFGPDNPIATNKTAEGRKKNRRIEFVRIK